MIKFFKRLFCKHYKVVFIRNISGDEVLEWAYNRSLWKCDKCSAVVPSKHLHNYEQELKP